MTKRNIRHAGEIAKKHEHGDAVSHDQLEIASHELQPLLEEKARAVYEQIYGQHDASQLTVKVDQLDVSKFKFRELSREPLESFSLGSVIVSHEDSASMQVSTDYLRRMSLDDWSQTTVGVICEYLRDHYHATYFFPSLSFLSIIKAHRGLFQRTMRGATGILFPGVLMVNGLGQWCVPAAHFKGNHTQLSLVPLGQPLGGYEVFLIERH